MHHKNLTALLLTLFLISACGPGGFSQFDRRIIGNYTFHEMGSYNKYISFNSEKTSRKVVDMTVIQYVNNDRYIIALRQPTIVLWKDETPDTETLKECDYWVIDSQTDKVVGPLSKAELNEKNKEMKVPLEELSTPISSYIRDHMNYCL